MSPTTEAPRRSRPRVFIHALGNVLIGVALGLVSYYFITDLVAQAEQSALADTVSDVPALGSTSPDRLVEEPVPEETGWETWLEDDVTFWEGLSEGEVFGRIVIEEMNLDTLVVKGVTQQALKAGPGWIPYTDLPGPTGNAGIAGHRATYSGPFQLLDNVEPGHVIQFYSPFRQYTYEVVSKSIVTPDRVDVMDSTEDPQLTLSGCHPPWSSDFRMIIQAKLVEMRRLQDVPEDLSF